MNRRLEEPRRREPPPSQESRNEDTFSAVQQVARMLAEAVGGKLVTLDLLGGAGLAGRSTYVELMRWNAHRLAQAAARLQPVPPGK